MARVVSMVTARVAAERVEEVVVPYREAIGEGLLPSIEETRLLRSDDGDLVIVTVWRDRSDLDAMLATGDEPFARKVLREAGGTPTAVFYDVLEDSRG